MSCRFRASTHGINLRCKRRKRNIHAAFSLRIKPLSTCHAVSCLSASAFLSAGSYCEAQQPSATPELLAENAPTPIYLPDAPSFGRGPEAQPSADPPEQQSTATIGGTVLDIREGLVPGAHVTLEAPSGAVQQTQTSDSSGGFLFKNVAPGNYKVRIIATGLESFVSYEITIHPGEQHQLPRTHRATHRHRHRGHQRHSHRRPDRHRADPRPDPAARLRRIPQLLHQLPLEPRATQGEA